jgi:NAD dependent epimerase/dehydratase family enzyme
LPTWFVKAIFGQMGDCLLLKGQRVLPSRLLKQGFIFRYANIADALAHELTKQA